MLLQSGTVDEQVVHVDDHTLIQLSRCPWYPPFPLGVICALLALGHGLVHYAHEDQGQALQTELHHLPLELPQLQQEAGFLPI